MKDSETLLQEVLTETEKKTNWRPLFLIMGLFIILWLINGVLLNGLPLEYRGVIGDMFGASNALFSGLALAAVAYSLWLQRKELELQRKVTMVNVMELRNSVKAQEGAAEAQKEQVEAMREQTKATYSQNALIDKQIKTMALVSQLETQVVFMNKTFNEIAKVTPSVIGSDYRHMHSEQIKQEMNESLGKVNNSIYKLIKHTNIDSIPGYGEELQ